MRFHAGDFSLDDAAWPGRPVEVDSDQIKTLIENDQHSTTWEIANILKISKSIKLVKIKNVPLFYGKNSTNFLANPIDFMSPLKESTEKHTSVNQQPFDK